MTPLPLLTFLFVRRALLAAAVVSAFGSAASAQRADVAESRGVVEQQLDAFQRDAWPEAYDFAAPSIQQVFPSPEIFSEMVRGQYPMVWRPSSVEFLGFRDVPGRGIVHIIEMVGPDGQTYIAEYFMREIDGEWRVAGVQIELRPGASV